MSCGLCAAAVRSHCRRRSQQVAHHYRVCWRISAARYVCAVCVHIRLQRPPNAMQHACLPSTLDPNLIARRAPPPPPGTVIPASSGGGGGMSTGAIAGIAVSLALGLIIALILACEAPKSALPLHLGQQQKGGAVHQRLLRPYSQNCYRLPGCQQQLPFCQTRPSQLPGLPKQSPIR